MQNLLLYSNEFIFDGKNYEEGGRTKWDLVIDRLGEVKSFLEIKSGFNDMDAAQVKHYGEEIRRVEKMDTEVISELLTVRKPKQLSLRASLKPI